MDRRRPGENAGARRPGWAATASSFSGTTVFGDSLSDGGDLSLLDGSSTIMRFTSYPGLTTVENVAAFFGLPLTPSLEGGTNYALWRCRRPDRCARHGGVPTLTAEVTAYLAANPACPTPFEGIRPAKTAAPVASAMHKPP